MYESSVWKRARADLDKEEKEKEKIWSNTRKRFTIVDVNTKI